MKNNKYFTNLKLSKDFLSTYIIRKSILDTITKYKSEFKGTHLDLGCGTAPYKEIIVSNNRVSNYICMDLEKSNIYDTSIDDIHWDGKKIPLLNNSVDSIHATEVFEHCINIEEILREINRVLKPGGFFLFTVPFIWPLHEIPNDEYRYTPFSLEYHLKNAGLNNIKFEQLGGWHASMAQMLGLWTESINTNHYLKTIIKYISVLAIKFLLKIDKKSSFSNGSMFTGIVGIIRK